MGAMQDKAKGKLKEAEGKLTGDRIREVQGKAEGTKGDVEANGTRIKGRVKSAANRAKARVQRATSRTRANASKRR